MKKITVIGDIMCEPPFFVQTGSAYDFHFAFEPLRPLLEEADLVIGNLETPLAGAEAGYTKTLVSFNTPDTIVDALKDAGVDVLLTANNHCLDRGEAGMLRTLRVLDEKGVPHTGTYAEPERGGEALYLTVGDTKIALLSYTYGTNHALNRQLPGDPRMVNLLRPIDSTGIAPAMPPYYQPSVGYIEKLLGREMEWIEKVELRKAMGIPIAYRDDRYCAEEAEPQLSAMEAAIRAASAQAELVLICPHMGGQFGTEPGAFSLYAAERMRNAGVSAILAAHNHTTLRAECRGGVPCFYSLGNVSMYPGSAYSVMESLPQYGIAAHLYVSEGKLVRTAFSLFKILASPEEPLRVVPVDALRETLDDSGKAELEREVAEVLLRVTGSAQDGAIRHEYALE